MDTDYSKFWIVGAGLLVGAIAGAGIWAQRATNAAAAAAERVGEDALIETARTVGTGSLAAALQGAMVGAVIGLALAGVYLYFTNPDRGMVERKVDSRDEY